MKTILLREFLFLSFCWFLSAFTLYGQSSTFYQTYDYQGAEKAFSLAPTPDGGYVMSGVQGITIGASRIIVIKTDSLGNEQWHKVYGNTYANESWAVIPLDDGGYLVGAETSGDQINASLYGDIYLLRLDEQGDTIWTKTLYEEGVEHIQDMKACPDGGYIIAGCKANTDEYCNAYALKIDGLGNKEWDKTYAIDQSLPYDIDVFYQVEILPDSGFIFGGKTEVPGLNVELFTVRTDIYGEEIWARTYGWEHVDTGRGKMMIFDGESIVLGGATSSFSQNSNYDLLLLKIDLNGDTLWTRRVDIGSKSITTNSVTLGNNGNYLVSARNTIVDPGGDLTLFNFNPDGEILWQSTLLDEFGIEKSYDLIQIPDGSIVIAGETSVTCSSCAFLMKITEDGHLSSINSTSIPEELNVYPNPGVGTFHINTSQTSGQGSILLYTSNGQMLKEYSFSSRNELVTTINLDDHPDGLYHIVLTNNKGKLLGQKSIVKISQ